jgi:hypothetical protein
MAGERGRCPKCRHTGVVRAEGGSLVACSCGMGRRMDVTTLSPKKPSPDWIRDCMRWHGRVLDGKHAHWCYEWDGLPIDETCDEWPCGCTLEDNDAE